MIDRSRNIETLVNWISSQNIGGVGQIKDETFLLITKAVAILSQTDAYIEYPLVDNSMSLVKNLAIETRRRNQDLICSQSRNHQDTICFVFDVVTKVLHYYITVPTLTLSKRSLINSTCDIIQENLMLLFHPNQHDDIIEKIVGLIIQQQKEEINQLKSASSVVALPSPQSSAKELLIYQRTLNAVIIQTKTAQLKSSMANKVNEDIANSSSDLLSQWISISITNGDLFIQCLKNITDSEVHEVFSIHYL
jgi:hypothetical protein